MKINYLPYKLAVIGSRSFVDLEIFNNTIQSLPKPSVLISGDYRGTDSIATTWAKDNDIKTKIYHPDWNLHGKSAGFHTNKFIINECDIVLIFWDKKCKEIKACLEYAKEINKPIMLKTYKI